MSKMATAKKLHCPASTKDVNPPHELLMCNFFIDLTKTDELQAQYQLLLHLRTMHNFYWKRHGKKLITRFSKRVAMRNHR